MLLREIHRPPLGWISASYLRKKWKIDVENTLLGTLDKKDPPKTIKFFFPRG